MSGFSEFSERAPQVLQIKPHLDEIGVALTWIRELGVQCRWPERTVFGLALSADEALTNIVNYAFEVTEIDSASIRLVCFESGQGIVLRIEDQGKSFDPTLAVSLAEAESLDDAVVGGHGLRLMRHYLKSLEYARENGRNVLTLVAGDGSEA